MALRQQWQAVHQVNTADVGRVENRQSMVELRAVIGGAHAVVCMAQQPRIELEGNANDVFGDAHTPLGGDLQARQTSQQRQPPAAIESDFRCFRRSSTDDDLISIEETGQLNSRTRCEFLRRQSRLPEHAAADLNMVEKN